MERDWDAQRSIPPADVSDLKEAVLGMGAWLGWSPVEIEDFAEALTGFPWSHMDRIALLLVLGEFVGLVAVIEAKEARRRMRRATTYVATA